MAFRDWFSSSKKEEEEIPESGIVQIGLKDIRKALETDGYETHLVDQIVTGLESRFTDKIQEKRVLDYDDFMSDVTQTIKGLFTIPDERIKICRRIDEFLKCNPEIQNSIRLYASYIVYGASEVGADEYTVLVTGDDDDEVERAREFIPEWDKATKIRRFMYLVAKDLVSYGDAFLEKLKDGDSISGVAYAPSNTFLMKVEGTESPLNYYQIIDPNVTFTDLNNPSMLTNLLEEKKVIEFNPEEIVYFNDGTLPGTVDAPLGSLTILWRFMRLIEEAFVIHRVTRARRMMVFFLDVTGKSKEQIRRTIGNFTSKLKSIFSIKPDSGSIHETRSNIPSSSDLVIPITKDSATKIQPISSDPSAAKIDDLKFYLNRILSNMLTLHIFSASQKGENTEPMERALSRIIKIYQKQMTYSLQELYQEVLETNGFNELRVTIQFPAIDNKAETEMVESVVRRAMIINQLVSVLGYAPPSEWSVRYIFKDIASSELDELIELIREAEEQQREQQEQEQQEGAGDESAEQANMVPSPEEAASNQAQLEAVPAPEQTDEPPNTLSYGAAPVSSTDSALVPKSDSASKIKLSQPAVQAKPSVHSLPDELVYGISSGSGSSLNPALTEKVKKPKNKFKIKMNPSYNKDDMNKALEIAVSYLQSMKR